MMPLLKNIPDKNPFKVPENYFDEVNKKIISATSGLNHREIKSSLFIRFKPYLLIAASVTVLFIISFAALKLMSPDEPNMQISDILFENTSEIFMSDLDILSLEQRAVELDLFDELPEINNEDIIDYLMFENIEINDIYEQL